VLLMLELEFRHRDYSRPEVDLSRSLEVPSSDAETWRRHSHHDG
jgi:hypothetical protein